MNYYKLTDENGQTRGETQWGENVTHRAVGQGSRLCTSGVIHVYDHPIKAVIFNSIHADFQSPRLWECRVRGVIANDQLKVGVKQCTTTKEIPLPHITLEQRVKFAVLYALEVYHEPPFVTWAKSWLSGKDRTAYAAAAAADAAHAARAAAYAAGAAAGAAVDAAVDAAANAAYAAEAAAYAAASVAEAAEAAEVADAAHAAAYAAHAAAYEKKLNLTKLLKQAMK